MNISGYLQWCARAMIREPLMWGLMLNILGMVALMAGCPAPWPQAMGILGMAIITFNVIYHIIAISYYRYQREQQETLEELRRK